MYRNLLFKRFPLRQIRNEYLTNTTKQLVDSKISVNTLHDLVRHVSVSAVFLKKRKTAEEKAVENHGRRVIRYSPKAGSEVVGIWRNMTVQDLANVLKKDIDHIFEALKFADKNTDTVYKKDTVIHNPQIVREVVKISGCRFKPVAKPDELTDEDENKDAVPAPPAPESALRPRPPVVCVMGHVDHGKTTLLDALRDTSVVDQEFGGITQHIGAFEVKLKSGERVTFLDTPGHAAFSAMRARGACATDVVVLVVAADDGVMQQTVESIRMAREANVPILVAINKIDKPGVNIERTLTALAQHGVVCEERGGEVQAVRVSALRRLHLDTLLEALALQAQLLHLQADPGSYVEGLVIEAQLDPRLGKQATVLVHRGTLRKGCVLVAGAGWAKVRMLQCAEGRALQEAAPAQAARVLGWRELPAAGDSVLEVSSEKRANEVMRYREKQRMKEKQGEEEEEMRARAAEQRAQYRARLAHKRALGRMRLKPAGPRLKQAQQDAQPAQPTLSLVVKGDVDGSVEAILDILETYDEHVRVRLHLVHYAVGHVTPNDIEIAQAFNAVVYAFNVECPAAVSAEARRCDVIVKHHNVIYRLVDDIKQEISARIPKRQEEEVLGEASVLQQFLVSEGRRRVPVAGCRCVRGALARHHRYRVTRDGHVLYQGKLASMKHLKEEVNTIKRDMECGLRFDTEVEVQPGDTVTCYKMVDVDDHTGWDPGF